ncbi:unnamed protein product [Dibothriocephalus latus]|uniref:Uncharacterized protein n=1 Tax=Dibothriocephalus latus TaxID=60516 RepID=A0A3P7L0Q7_DIBLA|nr:unnamed protein product [Dibothriocephalus latus]
MLDVHRHFLKVTIVLPDIATDSSTRTIVLEVKTCQIHLILKNASGFFDKKILFLTPQPATFPSCLVVSPCGSFLAILTETSVHILDLAKLEPFVQSQQVCHLFFKKYFQNKIVAKLVTAYDSLADSPDALRRLVRAKWHPTVKGVLLLLTRDGFLHLLRCNGSAGGSLSVKTEIKLSVLRTLEAGPKLSSEKENIRDNQKKGRTKLNLNFALGAVCTDFDIGSPLFTTDAKSYSCLFSSPVYVLCENGKFLIISHLPFLRDILMVSPSPNSYSDALVRVVRILPSVEDCYTFDFDSVLCMRSTDTEKSADVLCIASRSGRRSVPVLYLVEGVDLQLTKPLSNPKSRKDASVTPPSESLSSDGPPQLSKIYLLPAASNARDAHMAHYLCVHQFGIHCILLPWIGRLNQLCAQASDDTNSVDLASFPGDQGCTAEHLLLTHLDPKNEEESPLPGPLRSVIGVIPPQTVVSDTSTSRGGAVRGCPKVEGTEVNSLLVLFSSRPHVVRIVLPQSLSLSPQPHFLPQLGLPSGDSPDVSTISSLRSSRLGRLSTLCGSVYQFAEHAEGQLAAQYEAISYLAQERDQLQKKAVSLTERHSRILERQEALNHRLSELARRIFSQYTLFRVQTCSIRYTASQITSCFFLCQVYFHTVCISLSAV